MYVHVMPISRKTFFCCVYMHEALHANALYHCKHYTCRVYLVYIRLAIMHSCWLGIDRISESPSYVLFKFL